MAISSEEAIRRLRLAATEAREALYTRDDDAEIPADLVRRLALGLRDIPGGQAFELTPFGLRIVGATILGRLTLDNSSPAHGGPLCPLEFDNCTFDGGFSGAHGRFSRLSFRDCRFRDPPDLNLATIDLVGAFIQADFDLEAICADRAEDSLWIRGIGMRVDGELNLRHARLRAPSAAEVDAIDLTQAEIRADLECSSGFSAKGRFKGRNLSVGGDVWMTGASLDGLGRQALLLQSARIGGILILEGRCDDLRYGGAFRVFEARGEINLHQLRLGGSLTIIDAELRPSRFFTPPSGAASSGPTIQQPVARQVCLSLVAAEMDSARISSRFHPTELRGEIRLAHLEVKNELTFSDIAMGVDASDPGDALEGRLLVAKELIIDRVRPLPSDGEGGFEPRLRTLSINLDDSSLGRLKVVNSRLNGHLQAAQLNCSGDVEIDARIGRELNLEGANIGGSLDISRLRMDRGSKGLSLRDGNIAHALRIAHSVKTGEAQPTGLEEVRITRLESLPGARLIETLWWYRSEGGDRTLRQLAFLERRDVIRALDRRSDTLRSFIADHGHALTDPVRAAEFARLYCAYGQSECRNRWVVDGPSSLPPFASCRPPGAAPDSEPRPFADLPKAMFLIECPAPAQPASHLCFSLEACLLLNDRLERGSLDVTVCGAGVEVDYRPGSGDVIQVIGAPLSDGLFADHPDFLRPMGAYWVMPPVLGGSRRVSGLELVRWQERLRPHLGSDFSIYGTADLSDLSCDTLDDQGGRFWGRHVKLEINHFVYRQATWEPDGKPPRLSFWARRQRWWDRLRAEGFWPSRWVPAADAERLRQRTDLWEPWQIRRNWIYQHFKTAEELLCTARHRIREFEYRPQPFEQAIKVARAEGRAEFAIQFEMLKSRIEWQFFNRRSRWALGYFAIIAACVFLFASAREQAPVIAFGLASVMLMMALIPWVWEHMDGRPRWQRRILISLPFVIVVGSVFLAGGWQIRPLDFAVAALIFLVLRFGATLLDLGMRWMFGYLRRPVRALSTLFGAFLIGWVGVYAANQSGMMIIEATPVAVAAGYEGSDSGRHPVMVSPGGAVQRPFVHNARCGATISEPLYALDVLIPLIDLRQESRCDVGRVHRDDEEEAAEKAAAQMKAEKLADVQANRGLIAETGYHFWTQFSALPTKESFWSGLKALYAIAGWFLVSLSILTFAHINRVPAEP